MWRAFTLDGENLTMIERAVSNFLSLHYSSKRGYAFPSRESMSDYLGVNPRSITRAIRGLREKGIWGVVVGRGGTYKGKGVSTTSIYYPSATIVQKHIAAIKDARTRQRLEGELTYFNALVDSLSDSPEEASPGQVDSPEEEMPAEQRIKQEEEEVQERAVDSHEHPEGRREPAYESMPTVLAGALSRKEADEFLSSSKPGKIAEAYEKVSSLGDERGATVVAVTIRKALDAAKVPPVRHRDGWAGWLITFGLKHVPEKVHPLYNSATDLGGFVSLLDEINMGHQYKDAL